MNDYNTSYRQRFVGRRATRLKTSQATGKDVTEHWERLAGERQPIAGGSLALLEAQLEAIKP